MIDNKEQALAIVKAYKEAYPKLKEDEGNITSIEFNPQFNVEGGRAWIVEEQRLLFGGIFEYWYVLSAETGQVEYIFNHHGNRVTFHLD